jgi:hypothetical protein|tara:strand:- start:2044 stop:2946 length:903 start_codon:yes stop_codon:yes gene_type:complete
MKAILLFIILIILFILFTKYFIENFSLFNNNLSSHYFINNNLNNNNNNFIINSYPSNNLDFINNCNPSMEFNNDIYKKKLYNIFEINNNLNILFKISDNITWSKWKKPDSLTNKIYNKFIIYFNSILNNNHIINKYHTFNKFKVNSFNKYNFLFNIDVLLYRKNKIHAKHINLIVYYNNDKFNIIYLNIIGNVNEFNIKNKNFLKNTLNQNSVDFINSDFNNFNNCDDNCDSCNSLTDDYVNNNIENILIKKINNKSFNTNDSININKNINYYNNQNIVKKHFMDKLYKPTIIVPSNHIH